MRRRFPCVFARSRFRISHSLTLLYSTIDRAKKNGPDRLPLRPLVDAAHQAKRPHLFLLDGSGAATDSPRSRVRGRAAGFRGRAPPLGAAQFKIKQRVLRRKIETAARRGQYWGARWGR